MDSHMDQDSLDLALASLARDISMAMASLAWENNWENHRGISLAQEMDLASSQDISLAWDSQDIHSKDILDR